MSKGNRRKLLDKEAAPSASRPNPSTVSLRVETREDSPSSASASAPASTTATATTSGTCNKSATTLKDVVAGRKRSTVDYLGKALIDVLPEIPEESGAKSKVKPKVVKQAVVVAPVHEWRRPTPLTQSEQRLAESSHEFARRSRDQDTNDTSVGDLSRLYYGGSEDLADRMRKASMPLPPRTFYVPGADSSASLTRVLQRAQGPRNNALFPMFPGRRCIAAGRGTRVELHAHLEGSVRYETIWELMKSKKLSLPGDGSIRAVKDALIVREPMSLLQFLEPVPTYLQAIAGDLVALERIAYEFCEDKVEQGVLYVEAHYAPQMLTSHRHPRGRTLQELADVVMAINRGFRFAEVEMGIIVRTILAIIVGMGDCNDILHLVNQFRDQGIVGIDLHSSYEEFNKTDVFSPTYEEVPLTREEVRAFTVATSMGIHRTVHAGLMGSAYMVQRGIEKYRAQRIAHGYEVLKLPQLYIKCLERGVHFECCPWMSLLTCSVDGAKKHPVAQFAEDGANFSLSTSYPTITGLTLQEEYDLVTSWGLTEAHLVRSNINALRSSFLQPAEKGQLMQTLLENIGIKRRNAEK